MRNDEELPIIRAFYELVVWMNPKIAKFPRDHRFTLGQRMENQLYEILEKLVRAKYRRDRKGLLDERQSGFGDPAISNPAGQGFPLPAAEKLRPSRVADHRHRPAGRRLATFDELCRT